LFSLESFPVIIIMEFLVCVLHQEHRCIVEVINQSSDDV